MTHDITDLTPMSPCPLTSDVTSHTVAVVSALPVMNTDPSLANQKKVLRVLTNQKKVLRVMTNQKKVLRVLTNQKKVLWPIRGQ